MVEALDAASKAKIREAVREALREPLREWRTTIMKAFLTYQESLDGCMTALEAKLDKVEAGLSRRIAIVQCRMQEIEKKLHPPAA